MKIVFTIIALLFCLKLSASVNQKRKHIKASVADTGKVLAAAKTTMASPKAVPATTDSAQSNLSDATTADDNLSGLRPIISLVQLDSLKQYELAEQVRQARLRQLINKIEQARVAVLMKIDDIDSLKAALQYNNVDTLKAAIYTKIATKYSSLDNDSVTDEKQRVVYENAAIAYTLKALHEYSSYDDTTGLRISYTNLSTAYNAERKYTEAKWFILQANTISRVKRDTANIISTLLSLAAIKSEIKDYDLAMGDLNQALDLSQRTHAPKTELAVLKSFAFLYSVMQNYPKEEAALKRRDDLIDSIHKRELADLAKAIALKKKQDTLAKKKLYLASLHKTSKANSTAKVASL
jgi:tetratricopeptide (TPR) repeat protein